MTQILASFRLEAAAPQYDQIVSETFVIGPEFLTDLCQLEADHSTCFFSNACFVLCPLAPSRQLTRE